MRKILCGRSLFLSTGIVLLGVFFLGISTGFAYDDKTYQSLKLFTDVLDELENNYVDDVNSTELIHNAIKGMVGNLDPHSSFMPPEAFDDLQDETKGQFSGIGIVITMKDGILTVVSPIEGTPAQRAGILAGDIIIRIGDETTKGMALWEAVNKMRGPRHEEVLINIVREGETSPLSFMIKRDIIPLTSAKSSLLQPGYGYLRITNFRMKTLDEIKKHLASLEVGENKLKGLIIDLRDNPGGLLDQAIKISDLFLSKGVIVSIKGRQEKNTQVFNAYADASDYTCPLVVLINGGSASASEILAGALQDHSRALILGTNSFGKGSVQTVRPLKDGFGIKYTIARYYTPNGRSIQAMGIVPDIEVEPGVLAQKKDPDSVFDQIVKEKDLKNSLKPEEKKKKKMKKKRQREIDVERLRKDAQIVRALDILVSYNVFSKLNGQ